MSDKKKSSSTGISLVRKASAIDNPFLRHFIRKHGLEDQDALVLGVLLDLTDQMKTPIKTTYRAIADTAELSTMEVYRSVGSLHRHRIVEYKPTGNYVHISFREIDESIEEITLAYANARQIRKIEEYLRFVRAQNYVPSADLFDLIYPIIGKLVAARIAEALRSLVNYINSRLESSFSLRLWRYRFRSLRTGIPVAEIVLRNSVPCYIEEIFLLEKKSSLLMGHVSRTGETTIDRDLVGGMLGAISDFIKTSFKSAGSGIDEVQFGDYRIKIFESVYFYAAVVFYGSPDLEFVERVNGTIEGIHAVYRRHLKNFSGDMRTLRGIDRPLRELVDAANSPASPAEANQLVMVKAAAAIIALLCAAGTAWWAVSSYRDYRLQERIRERIERALPRYSHDVVVTVDGGTAVVEGTVGSARAGDAVTKEVRRFGEIAEVRNRAVVADYRSLERYRADLDALRAGLDAFQLVVVKQELEKIVVQFPTGVTAMGNPQMLQVKRVGEILKEYARVHVDIVAFNDPEGGFDVNKALAERRMRSVRDSLVRLGIEKGRMHLLDFDPDILSSDPRFAEFRDRRGIMLFARYPD